MTKTNPARRRCNRCGELKSLSEFAKKKDATLGRNYTCKTCDAKRAREYRKTDEAKEVRKRYMKSNGAKSKYKVYRARSKKYREEWAKSENGKKKIRSYIKHYASKNPEKVRAHWAIGTAVKRGHLSKPERCSIDDENCKGRIEAHHPDYLKRMEVVWLCRRHHRILHGLEEAD